MENPPRRVPNPCQGWLPLVWLRAARQPLRLRGARMRYAIIWTWLQPRDNANPSDADPLEAKQKVGYFTTLDEAYLAFEEPSFGEKELVCILKTDGYVPPQL